LLDEERLAVLFAEVRPDVIVHLASALRDDPTEVLVRTNILGIERLYNALAVSKISAPRIIVGSSGSIYGAVAAEHLPVREEVPPAPFDMYSISKVAQERVARMLGSRLEISTMVVRIFNIVGQGQDERHFCGQIAAQFVDIETGRRTPTLSVGPLTTTRDFIDVRDVADGLIAVAKLGENGVTYNLGSGREVAMQEVFDEMAQQSRLPKDVQIISKPGRKADMPRNVAAIDRIAALGFAPRFSLRQSLIDVLDYYRGLHVNAN
jgi:GDP-4-dehydro-6-deoxy-D-mannose reductase